jgi:hypothetical protein
MAQRTVVTMPIYTSSTRTTRRRSISEKRRPELEDSAAVFGGTLPD